MSELTANLFECFRNCLGDRYQPYIRQHLAKVYMIFGVTVLATAIGAVAQIFEILDLGLFASLAAIGLLLTLYCFKCSGKNYDARFRMLMVFGFCSGQALGPVLQYINDMDPGFIWTALMSTIVVFTSLSLSALLAQRGTYLFLGGILVSVVNAMALTNLLNIYLQSQFVQSVQLYAGVFVVATYILVDTQSIIEKRRKGDRDAVQHAVDLFFDAFNLFWRLMFVLAHKKGRKVDGMGGNDSNGGNGGNESNEGKDSEGGS